MVHRVNSQDSQPSRLSPETKAKLDRLAALAATDPAIMQKIEQAIETDILLQINALDTSELTDLKLLIEDYKK
ncbi:MAG: hypothetical protein ACK5ST_02260 [bacterium]|jgi:predicted transcriptional regulator